MSAAVITSDADAIAVARALAVRWRRTAAAREALREVPRAELDEMSATGLGAITVPREFGGADVSARTLTAVIRAIASADPSLAQIPQNHYMGVEGLAWALPETRRLFYDELLRGARFGSAVSERGARRDGIATTIVPEGDVFRIDGTKYYSTGSLTADWVRVVAIHPDGRPRVAFVAAGTPGLTVESDWGAFGQRLTYSGTTRLEGVRVPAVQVVPWEAERAQGVLAMAVAQVIHAAIEVGISEGALADALEALGPSGRVTLREDPLRLAALGLLRARVAAARSIVTRAADRIDAVRAVVPAELEAAQAAMNAVEEAKALTYDAALAVAGGAIDLVGPEALRSSLALDRHWRNSRTHTLHDAVRWKLHIAGDAVLNGHFVAPPAPSAGGK